MESALVRVSKKRAKINRINFQRKVSLPRQHWKSPCAMFMYMCASIVPGKLFIASGSAKFLKFVKANGFGQGMDACLICIPDHRLAMVHCVVRADFQRNKFGRTECECIERMQPTGYSLWSPIFINRAHIQIRIHWLTARIIQIRNWRQIFHSHFPPSAQNVRRFLSRFFPRWLLARPVGVV